jgi:hypothetical protein
MNRVALALLLFIGFPAVGTPADADTGPPNPAIDMKGYLQISQEAAAHRATRRLTVEEFLRMSKEPGTIVLDARSKDKYEMLHVEGAINLPFTDIAIESVKRVIPDKNTRILIYCNNNFVNNERAFESKLPRASLNLSTYIALYTYGYRNIYELGPRLDTNDSKLPLVSSPQSKPGKGAAR